MNKVANLALAISEVDKDPSKELTVDISGYRWISFAVSYVDNKAEIYIFAARRDGGMDDMGIKVSKKIVIEASGKDIAFFADTLIKSTSIMIWRVSVATVEYDKELGKIRVEVK